MGHSIFLATPAFGGMVDVVYLESVLKLGQFCQQHNLPLNQCFLTTASIITEARNELAKQFLATDASHLLFIDADIGFNSSIVSKALQYDTDILCQPYPSKTINWPLLQETGLNKNLEQLRRAGLSYHIHLPEGQLTIKDGLTEVLHAPTGCMIIKRIVFERIMQQRPELYYKRLVTVQNQQQAEDYWGFFDLMSDQNGFRLGEDYSFCERASQTGSTIMADINEDISHLGKMEFRGRLLDKVTINNEN